MFQPTYPFPRLFGYFLAEPDPNKYGDAYARQVRYIGPTTYSSYTTGDSYYWPWAIGSRAFYAATTNTLPLENQAPKLPDGGDDRNLGTLILWLYSCYGDAPGVVLSGLEIPDLPHSPWLFFGSGGPDPTLSQTSNNASGVGIAVSGGIPPHHYILGANLAKDGRPVGKYGVEVWPDTVTLVTVGPMPP